MKHRRSGDEPGREGRWFFWLLAILALVVAADSLHVLPGSEDPAAPRPKADVLGRVITRDTAPGGAVQAPPAPAPAVTQPASTVPLARATVQTTAQPVPPTRARVTTTTRAPTTTTVEEATTTTTNPPPDPPTTVNPEP